MLGLSADNPLRSPLSPQARDVSPKPPTLNPDLVGRAVFSILHDFVTGTQY